MQVVADRAEAPTAIPNGSSRNLRFIGTEPVDLADHVSIARPRGEDVEAFGSGRRYRRLAQTVLFAQGKSASTDRPGFPDYRHPGGRSGRLLDPPGAAVRRDREPRGRRRVDPD